LKPSDVQWSGAVSPSTGMTHGVVLVLVLAGCREAWVVFQGSIWVPVESTTEGGVAAVVVVKEVPWGVVPWVEEEEEGYQVGVVGVRMVVGMMTG